MAGAPAAEICVVDSLELDWDAKSVEELAADERCPPLVFQLSGVILAELHQVF